MADVPLDPSLQRLKLMVSRGKERGYITYDEFHAALPNAEVSSEQIEDLMALLGELGISLVERGDNGDDGETSPAPIEPRGPAPFQAGAEARIYGGGGG